ncbi:MAG: hypothetical protein HOQ07_11780 [Sinomonas sp.]|nr:hypothetical protein [Sinomonas sp.]
MGWLLRIAHTQEDAGLAMFVPGPGDQFREYDLPVRIGALPMPTWVGASSGAVLLVVPVAAVAGSILVNESDSTLIPGWAEALVIAAAMISAIVGAFRLWHAGEWVTLTRDAAIVTKGFIAQVRVDRAQLEDFHPYLHQYAARGGVQYRMVPTFTVRDPHGRLRDVPLPFLSYWNPDGGTQAPLPPGPAYIEAWARAASSPYSRSAYWGTTPEELWMHRQTVGTGLRRRALVAAVLVPLVSIGLGLGLGFGLSPASKALGLTHSADAQTNRAGIRDLDDSLTPTMAGYQWRSREIAPGIRNFTFYPTLRSLPSSPYTIQYFIRDPAQNGPALSIPEQKYGRIIAQVTITSANPSIEFTLENDETVFAFELYVTDGHGHTTYDSDLYRRIVASPTPAS